MINFRYTYLSVSIIVLVLGLFFGCSNPNNIADIAEGNTTEETSAEEETASKYTVNFETNGGSSVADIADVTEGTTISAPSEPAKSGYVFDGWYVDSGLNTAWDFANDTVTSDITLYAKWRLPLEYTVSFDSNEGTSITDITGVTEGSTITAPSEPTKPGTFFTGWYVDADFTDKWDFSSDTVTSNTTLYACWKDPLYLSSFQSDYQGYAIEGVQSWWEFTVEDAEVFNSENWSIYTANGSYSPTLMMNDSDIPGGWSLSAGDIIRIHSDNYGYSGPNDMSNTNDGGDGKYDFVYSSYTPAEDTATIWIEDATGEVIDFVFYNTSGNTAALPTNSEAAAATNSAVALGEWPSADTNTSFEYDSKSFIAKLIDISAEGNEKADWNEAQATEIQGDWKYTGSSHYSAGRPLGNAIAMSSSGTPYVFFRDDANDRKATVMTLNGNDWMAVGNEGFTQNGVVVGDIALDSNDTPYVFFKDQTNGMAYVMEFDGSAWIFVGSEGFSGGEIGTQFGNHSMDFNSNDTPYVVFEDSTGKAKVMKFDGTSWNSVGENGTVSDSAADFSSIAIGEDDTVYVLYIDKHWNTNDDAVVKKLNGTTWELVGEARFTGSTEIDFIDIAVSNEGNPFVVYKDIDNSGYVSVMKFNGTDWIQVGNKGFSTEDVLYCSIDLDSYGNPYVAFMGSDSYRLTMMKYDGTAWVDIGIDNTKANYPVMEISPNDTPFVAFEDMSAVPVKGLMMKYEP